MTAYAEVVLPLPVDHSFFYVIPEELNEKVEVGSRILVPFHRRFLTGFVVRLRQRNPSQKIEYKRIERVLDEEPVFSQSFLAFTRKLSSYYFSSWGEVLQASLPPSLVVQSKIQVGLSPDAEIKKQGLSLDPWEKMLLEFLQKGSYSQDYLKRKFSERNIAALLSRLEKKGLIERTRDIPKQKISPVIDAQIYSPTQLEMDFSLDEKSRKVAEMIGDSTGKQRFSPFLLQADDEKREAVYFSVMKSSLAAGKRVLFLLPEIALTQSFMDRFYKKLGKRAAVLHSRLPVKQRLAEWNRIREGGVDVVIGPRSALLSHIDDLGLIILDEEQDQSYYQRQTPIFDARKGAWIRAKHEGLVLVYGSSFPSVESMFRAKKSGYFLQIAGKQQRGSCEIIEYRGEKKIFSPEVIEKIRLKLRVKEPVVVFCTRRGYAPFVACSRCSFVPRCVNCKISLSYHKKEQKWVCHYCHYSKKHLDFCPECGLRLVIERGEGIEIVEEKLRLLFPRYNVVSFDKDAAADQASQAYILDRFLKGKIDILLGTQFLAHQFNWPRVRFVIVFRPEMALARSDYRTGQNLYHEIKRMVKFLEDDKDSELVIQTPLPDHYSLRHAVAGNHQEFFKQEIRYRRILAYPPFSYLAEVVFQDKNLRTLAKKMRAFLSFQAYAGIEVLGPALPPVSKIRGKNQIQIILKSKKKKLLDEALRRPLKDVKVKKSVYIYD